MDLGSSITTHFGSFSLAFNHSLYTTQKLRHRNSSTKFPPGRSRIQTVLTQANPKKKNSTEFFSDLVLLAFAVNRNVLKCLLISILRMSLFSPITKKKQWAKKKCNWNDSYTAALNKQIWYWLDSMRAVLD